MASIERKLARGQHREEQDASLLKFGELFDPPVQGNGLQTLSMSEAAVILLESQERRRLLYGPRHGTNGGGVNGSNGTAGAVSGIGALLHNGQPMSEAMRKTVEYMDAFAKFKSEETCVAAADLLAGVSGLHAFEAAQLKTLCPEAAEEAKTLIPTLGPKVADEELQSVLDNLTDIQRYV